METVKIDTSGLSCPQPIMMLTPHLNNAALLRIEVIVDNEASFENITRASKNKGWQSSSIEIGIDKHCLTLTRP